MKRWKKKLAVMVTMMIMVFSMAITAFAGPLANIIVAFVALLLFNIFQAVLLKAEIGIIWYANTFLYYIALIYPHYTFG